MLLFKRRHKTKDYIFKTRLNQINYKQKNVILCKIIYIFFLSLLSLSLCLQWRRELRWSGLGQPGCVPPVTWVPALIYLVWFVLTWVRQWEGPGITLISRERTSTISLYSRPCTKISGQLHHSDKAAFEKKNPTEV